MTEFTLSLIVAATTVMPVLFLLATIVSILRDIQHDLQRYRRDLAERQAITEAKEWVAAARAKAAAEEGK